MLKCIDRSCWGQLDAPCYAPCDCLALGKILKFITVMTAMVLSKTTVISVADAESAWSSHRAQKHTSHDPTLVVRPCKRHTSAA